MLDTLRVQQRSLPALITCLKLLTFLLSNQWTSPLVHCSNCRGFEIVKHAYGTYKCTKGIFGTYSLTLLCISKQAPILLITNLNLYPFSFLTLISTCIEISEKAGQQVLTVLHIFLCYGSLPGLVNMLVYCNMSCQMSTVALTHLSAVEIPHY